ncbi:MAG: hypothetical protein JRH20_09955 [Deltaproteobacteria bacterium]|nr:hypothetical protein [Deltaproteobacteria bacterium]
MRLEIQVFPYYPTLVNFDEHLQRYLSWLKSLEGAPPWLDVRFASTCVSLSPPWPTRVSPEAFLTPAEFEPEFEQHMDGRYTWVNFECLGVIGETIYLTIFVSSRGPYEPGRVPRDRIAVNFSGPSMGPSPWDGHRRIVLG